MAIDLRQMLAENDVTGAVTRFILSAGISFTAFSEAGTTASMEIRSSDPITTVIPAPTSTMLLGLRLLGTFVLAKSRIRHAASGSVIPDPIRIRPPRAGHRSGPIWNNPLLETSPFDAKGVLYSRPNAC